MTSLREFAPIPDGYTLQQGYPPIKDYLNLRQITGLTPKTEAQASKVASGSWYGVMVIENATGSIVGMGRILGDGGWYFHVVDMAVHPDHQRRGLGDAIMRALLTEIEEKAPPNPYVNLLADGPGRRLYERHGFAESAPKTVGMQRYEPPR